MTNALLEDSHGTVLVDVLTSMTFVLLLIGMTQPWARAVLYSQRTLETVTTANHEAALALEAVARDIRDAGFDGGTEVRPIVAAGSDFLELTADLNDDGDTLDAHEHVRYAYRADRRQMTRASGQGSPQPFTDDVPAGGLRFSFFDGNANEVASGPSGVGEVDLPRIRRIDARLAVELRNPDPRATAPIRAEAAIAVALRNQ